MDVPRCRIGVIGITFKENCPDIRNSKVIDLVHELKDHGATVVVQDPLADPAEVRQAYGIELTTISREQPVDALVVAVGHNVYRAMAPSELKHLVKGDAPVLVDVKSLYQRAALVSAGFTIFRL